MILHKMRSILKHNNLDRDYCLEKSCLSQRHREKEKGCYRHETSGDILICTSIYMIVKKLIALYLDKSEATLVLISTKWIWHIPSIATRSKHITSDLSFANFWKFLNFPGKFAIEVRWTWSWKTSQCKMNARLTGELKFESY